MCKNYTPRSRYTVDARWTYINELPLKPFPQIQQNIPFMHLPGHSI